jgi:pyruvate-ferredoxin/flavodoxin oxidoreductase
VNALLSAQQNDETGIYEQRERVKELKEKLKNNKSKDAEQLLSLADNLVKRSIWIMGGDGWAYDIGFGGLDHVLSSGRDVNVLVLDTEVYSNTGGQMSKATPRAAVAKFAAAGKPAAKKDLGLMAMTYGNVYVTSIALGARDDHTVRAILEAEAYSGPSLILANSHCIAHGINMTAGLREQKKSVQSGHWPLFRFNPTLAAQGKNPLTLDSPAPTLPLKEFLYGQNRFKMLTKSHPDHASKLLEEAQEDVKARRAFYEYYASMPGHTNGHNKEAGPPAGAQPQSSQSPAGQPKEGK